MNRLCQSSYGSLEAVINFAGCDGNPERQLVHFYRDRISGTWSKVDVISTKPSSGGSIIQNCAKRDRHQNHGDFEVLVLEEDGLMKHYTRDNTVSVDSGDYAWKLSAVVNEGLHPQYGQVVVCDAAPLYQMKLSTNSPSQGYSMETVLLAKTGDALNYRCHQSSDGEKQIRYHWKFVSRIMKGATGPVCLYQDSNDDLRALVPVSDGIAEFNRWGFGTWNRIRSIENASGPACTYRPNPSDISLVHAVVRHEGNLSVKTNMRTENKASQRLWLDCSVQLPPSLEKLYRSDHHKEGGGIPMAIISQSTFALGHSPNVEAIVFHPCGTGWQDRWMVLHWSCLAATSEWMVSGVVLAEVKGMPM
ncbi:hypothetical protein F5B19DRAFT_470570 [Rostrohypoxylon terebratum]|nr:hypothetical protein F5B19DRAFT_470570 [Rostrohypoxylon terebratum]